MEYYSVEPSSYYTLSLWRFRAVQFILSGMAAAELRSVLLADLRDTIFQGGLCSRTQLLQLLLLTAAAHAWLAFSYWAGDLRRS